MPGHQLAALGLVGARQRQQGTKRGARRNAPRTEPAAAPTREGPRPGPAASTPREAATEALGQRSERKPRLLLDLLQQPALFQRTAAPLGLELQGEDQRLGKHASAARWPAWCRGRAARAPTRGRSRRSARSDPGPSPGRPARQRGSRLDPPERGTPASGPNASDLGSAAPRTGGPAGGARSPWSSPAPASRAPPSVLEWRRPYGPGAGEPIASRTPARGMSAEFRVGIRGVGAPSRLAPRTPVVGPFPQPRQPLGARSRLAPRPSSVAPAGRRGRPRVCRLQTPPQAIVSVIVRVASPPVATAPTMPGPATRGRTAGALPRPHASIRSKPLATDPTRALAHGFPSKGKPDGSATTWATEPAASSTCQDEARPQLIRASSLVSGGSALASRGGSNLASVEAPGGHTPLEGVHAARRAAEVPRQARPADRGGRRPRRDRRQWRPSTASSSTASFAPRRCVRPATRSS